MDYTSRMLTQKMLASFILLSLLFFFCTLISSPFILEPSIILFRFPLIKINEKVAHMTKKNHLKVDHCQQNHH